MDRRVIKTKRAIKKAFFALLAEKDLNDISVTDISRIAEINRKTVIQYDPQSTQADEYRALARAIDENTNFAIPKPMTQERLEEILLEYGLMDSLKDNYNI